MYRSTYLRRSSQFFSSPFFAVSANKIFQRVNNQNSRLVLRTTKTKTKTQPNLETTYRLVNFICTYPLRLDEPFDLVQVMKSLYTAILMGDTVIKAVKFTNRGCKVSMTSADEVLKNKTCDFYNQLHVHCTDDRVIKIFVNGTFHFAGTMLCSAMLCNTLRSIIQLLTQYVIIL